MSHDDKGKATVDGNGFEKRPERLDTTRRSTDADDMKLGSHSCTLRLVVIP